MQRLDALAGVLDVGPQRSPAWIGARLIRLAMLFTGQKTLKTA
jgi:hypothetical protein